MHILEIEAQHKRFQAINMSMSSKTLKKTSLLSHLSRTSDKSHASFYTPARIPNESARAYALFQHIMEQRVVIEGLVMLETSLPEQLKFHTVSHTYDVLKESLLFAVTDQLSEQEIELLAIAATYHDTGFTKQSENNKELSVETARTAMLKHGYSGIMIATVEGVIRATAPQPLCNISKGADVENKLGCYIRDADWGFLGRDDFYRQVLNLYLEERSIGSRKLTLAESKLVLEEAVALLSQYEWKSAAAKELREAKKRSNLLNAEASLEGISAFLEAA